MTVLIKGSSAAATERLLRNARSDVLESTAGSDRLLEAEGTNDQKTGA